MLTDDPGRGSSDQGLFKCTKFIFARKTFHFLPEKPINFEIAIGKKDDFAGSVYVYYIDENKHNYNTSYVTFELEYKKQ